MGREPYRILLVDDEPDLRGLLAEKLKLAGFEVFEARDGEEALELTQTLVPDLVVSDVIMPDKDGNFLLKEIRKTELGSYVLFVVLTARPGMRDYFETMGVDDFIEKPVTGEEFITRIKKILHGRGAEIRLKRQEHIKGGQDAVPGGTAGTSVNAGILAGSEGLRKGSRDLEMPSAEQARPVPAPRPGAVSVNKSILLAEDDPFVSQKLQSLFVRKDYDVAAASSLQECLALVSQFRPDIILTKSVLPEISGEELADKFKGVPALQKVPIVIYADVLEKVYVKEGPEQFRLTAAGEELLRTINNLLA